MNKRISMYLFISKGNKLPDKMSNLQLQKKKKAWKNYHVKPYEKSYFIPITDFLLKLSNDHLTKTKKTKKRIQSDSK